MRLREGELVSSLAPVVESGDDDSLDGATEASPEATEETPEPTAEPPDAA
jgi:hypothetical protein